LSSRFTYRDIEALNKQKEKVQNSRIHHLYRRCYKKLNQRYNRKSITLDESNKLICDIISLKKNALSSNISANGLKDLLSDI